MANIFRPISGQSSSPSEPVTATRPMDFGLNNVAAGATQYSIVSTAANTAQYRTNIITMIGAFKKGDIVYASIHDQPVYLLHEREDLKYIGVSTTMVDQGSISDNFSNVEWNSTFNIKGLEIRVQSSLQFQNLEQDSIIVVSNICYLTDGVNSPGLSTGNSLLQEFAPLVVVKVIDNQATLQPGTEVPSMNQQVLSYTSNTWPKTASLHLDVIQNGTSILQATPSWTDYKTISINQFTTDYFKTKTVSTTTDPTNNRVRSYSVKMGKIYKM